MARRSGFGALSKGGKIGLIVGSLTILIIILVIMFGRSGSSSSSSNSSVISAPPVVSAPPASTPPVDSTPPVVSAPPVVVKSPFTTGPDKTVCRVGGIDDYGRSNPLSAGKTTSLSECENYCAANPACKAFEINGAKDHCWYYGNNAVPLSASSLESGHYCSTKN